MHMSSYGHQLMAVEVLDALGVGHDLKRPALEPSDPPTLREHLEWAGRMSGRGWLAGSPAGRPVTA